jgi:16S rRNA (uracil1498-N3)-methyltransferase
MFYSPLFSAQNPFLDEEESHHLIKVLRILPPFQCQIIDGKGNIFEADLMSIEKKICKFEIKKQTFFPPNPISFHLAIAPTKNIDRIEWLLEKTVELGIQKITFLLCERSQRKQINIERLHKIAAAALKQSKNIYMPIITDMIDFKKFIQINHTESQRFLAHLEDETQDFKKVLNPNQNILMLIGAEGDFSPTEIELAKKNNYQMVSLGKSTLRTETAGLYACMAFKWINS